MTDEKRNSYEVVMLDECSALTNAMRALAIYRRKNKGQWPSAVYVSRYCRIKWKFGEDCILNTKQKFVIDDAFYLSHWRPREDDIESVEREATPKPKERNPIPDTIRYFRYRSK